MRQGGTFKYAAPSVGREAIENVNLFNNLCSRKIHKGLIFCRQLASTKKKRLDLFRSKLTDSGSLFCAPMPGLDLGILAPLTGRALVINDGQSACRISVTEVTELFKKSPIKTKICYFLEIASLLSPVSQAKGEAHPNRSRKSPTNGLVLSRSYISLLALLIVIGCTHRRLRSLDLQ